MPINNAIMAKPSRPHPIFDLAGPETGIPLGMALSYTKKQYK